MGLIRKLKDMFNKNIECGSEISDHVVFPITKRRWLYLNKNIFVREKNSAVVVYKYRVCDVIYEGKFRLNQDTIPETYSRAKIERINRKGAKVKRIRGNVYYVNLNEFKNFPFESDVPFYVKSGTLGRVKGFIEGTCTLKVIDPGALVRALIHDTGKAKLNEIHSDIGLWIGNKINQIVEKNKIPATRILTEQEYVETIINTEMEKALDRIGIFVSNVNLKAVNFPKKYQEKVNAYMTEHQRPVKKFDINANFGMNSSPTTKVAVSRESAQNQKPEFIKSTSSISTMQNIQKPANIQQFKECRVCRKKNNIDAKICIGCGSKLDN